MAKATEAEDSDGVMALAGLRRLVLHARDQLAAHIYEPKWDSAYNAWEPWQVKQHSAMLMARQTLTLVADCLPGDAGISADEAAERAAKAADAVERQKRRAQALADQLEAAQRARADVEAERDRAVEYQEAADVEAAAWSEQWQRLLQLAQSDVPAAMRYLMSGGVEEEDARAPVDQESMSV